jgi:hypothetical protein
MNTLNRVLLIAIVSLAGILVTLNIKLTRQNDQLKRQLTTGIRDMGRLYNSPAVGTELPMLEGHNQEGRVIGIDLAHSEQKMCILLFDPECKTCEENWKYWSKLTSRNGISNRLVPISTTQSVPKEYMMTHWHSSRPYLIGLDPAIQDKFKLRATPQTIVVVSGKVDKTWYGLLSDSDVDEISKELIISR